MKTGTELREEAERQKSIGDAIAALTYADINYPIHPRPNMVGSEWENRVRREQQIAEKAFKAGIKHAAQSREAELTALREENEKLKSKVRQLQEEIDTFSQYGD